MKWSLTGLHEMKPITDQPTGNPMHKRLKVRPSAISEAIFQRGFVMNWEYLKPLVSDKVFKYLLGFSSSNGPIDRTDIRRILEKHGQDIDYTFYGEFDAEKELIKWSEVYK